MRARRRSLAEVRPAIARSQKGFRNLSIRYAKRIVKHGEGEVGGHDILNVRNSSGLKRTRGRMDLVKEFRAPLSAEHDGDCRIAEGVGAQRRRVGRGGQAAKGAIVTPDSFSRRFSARRIEDASGLSP